MVRPAIIYNLIKQSTIFSKILCLFPEHILGNSEFFRKTMQAKKIFLRSGHKFPVHTPIQNIGYFSALPTGELVCHLLTISALYTLQVIAGSLGVKKSNFVKVSPVKISVSFKPIPFPDGIPKSSK